MIFDKNGNARSGKVQYFELTNSTLSTGDNGLTVIDSKKKPKGTHII